MKSQTVVSRACGSHDGASPNRIYAHEPYIYTNCTYVRLSARRAKKSMHITVCIYTSSYVYTALQTVRPRTAGGREGNNMNGSDDSRTENGSSQGQNQPLAVSHVASLLDKGSSTQCSTTISSKVTCLAQITPRPYVVQIGSRNPPNLEERNPQPPPSGRRTRKRVHQQGPCRALA